MNVRGGGGGFGLLAEVVGASGITGIPPNQNDATVGESGEYQPCVTYPMY